MYTTAECLECYEFGDSGMTMWKVLADNKDEVTRHFTITDCPHGDNVIDCGCEVAHPPEILYHEKRNGALNQDLFIVAQQWENKR